MTYVVLSVAGCLFVLMKLCSVTLYFFFFLLSFFSFSCLKCLLIVHVASALFLVYVNKYPYFLKVFLKKIRRGRPTGSKLPLVCELLVLKASSGCAHFSKAHEATYQSFWLFLGQGLYSVTCCRRIFKSLLKLFNVIGCVPLPGSACAFQCCSLRYLK